MVFQVLFLMKIRTWEEYFFLYARGQRKEASKSPERVSKSKGTPIPAASSVAIRNPRL